MTDVALKQLDRIYFDPALAAIEKDFQASPILQAKLTHSLALTLGDFGNYPKALQVIESTLARQRKLLGDADPQTLDSQVLRGQINQALGSLAQAEHDFVTALATMRQHLGSRHPLTIETLITFGEFLLGESKDQQAFEILSEAVNAARVELGNKHLETLTALRLFGVSMFRSGRIEDAEKITREALEGFRALPDRKTEQLIALTSLADIMIALDRPDLAVTYGQETVRESEHLYGNKHQVTLGMRSCLASSLSQNGEFAKSLALHREVKSGLYDLFGADHTFTLKAQTQFGVSLRRAGQYSEAQKVLESVLVECKCRGSESDARGIGALFQLGLLQKEQGNLEAAERLLSESLNAQRRMLGEAHQDTLATIAALKSLRDAPAAR